MSGSPSIGMKPLYLAYGSNLHPVRLQQRVASASPEGRVQLPGYRLEFHKRGQDGSGKCNIRFTGEAVDRVFGVVYSLDPQQVPILDRFEGPGYERRHITVDVGGQARPVFAYVALDHHCDPRLRPFRWYLQLVLCGALYHRFPSRYLDLMHRVPVVDDPDSERREANRGLLERMRAQTPPRLQGLRAGSAAFGTGCVR